MIWKISKEELYKVVKENTTISSILKHFGLSNKGGNYKSLKNRLNEDEIDYSHIVLGIDSNKGKKIPKEEKPLKDVLVEGSTYSRGILKKRLLKNGMLTNKCYICGQLPEWNGEKLVMIIDHINGVSNDHRLENLRMLCPNCNSQQPTFAGRRLRKKYYCNRCGAEKKTKQSNLCDKCAQFNRRKVVRPNKQTLQKEIDELGYCGTARKYGVTDNAIRKWIK